MPSGKRACKSKPLLLGTSKPGGERTEPVQLLLGAWGAGPAWERRARPVGRSPEGTKVYREQKDREKERQPSKSNLVPVIDFISSSLN